MSTFGSSTETGTPDNSSLVLVTAMLTVYRAFNVDFNGIGLTGSTLPAFADPGPSVFTYVPTPLVALVSIAIVGNGLHSLTTLVGTITGK